MPNPTRQDIIDAHDALAELRALVESNPPRHDTHAEKLESRIFAALPPLPQPTMADVVWDEDKYFLAEAEHYKYGKVVMLKKDPFAGNITVLYKDEDGFNDLLCTNSKYLTPTDTKYVLKEVY